MGETAQTLARRYPGEAEPMIRKLGVEGMTAVRVYGADVAQVIAREGPETIGVLRKTGRGGWGFFTDTVLPHKKKLAAAGVLALFLANPEQFVDTAGKRHRVRRRAVRQGGHQPGRRRRRRGGPRASNRPSGPGSPSTASTPACLRGRHGPRRPDRLRWP